MVANIALLITYLTHVFGFFSLILFFKKKNIEYETRKKGQVLTYKRLWWNREQRLLDCAKKVILWDAFEQRIRKRIHDLINKCYRKTALWLVCTFDIVIVPSFNGYRTRKKTNRRTNRRTVGNVMTWSCSRFRNRLLSKAKTGFPLKSC